LRSFRIGLGCVMGVLAMAGLTHMYSSLFLRDNVATGLDFRLVWLAGKLWLAGESPYGPFFAKTYAELFGQSINMYWSYPPSWFPISALVGLASFDLAFRIWSAANIAMTIVGTWLIARAVAAPFASQFWLVFLAGLAFALSMQATEIAIFIGQTSFVVYIGLAALVCGLLTSFPILLILGLFITALKPHVGLVAFVAVLALPRYRWTVLAAGAASLLAAAGVGDYLDTLRGFLANLALYARPGNALNNPENLTGMTNIVNALFDTPSNSLFSVVLTLIGSAGGFVALRCYNEATASSNEGGKISSLIAFVAVTLLFVPLHAYDMVALTIVFMLALFMDSVWKWPILTATLLCNHPRILAFQTHLVNPRSLDFQESLFISLMLIVILASSMVALATSRSSHSMRPRNRQTEAKLVGQ
jgi:hypothetical protein